MGAALSVSRTDGESGGSFPTGQALGRELGVDRSSIWRHFRDRDDLMIAVADAMLEPVAAAVREQQAPEMQLRTIWNGVLDAFAQHPHVGVELGNRFLSGPHVAVIIERTLDVFVRLGIETHRAAAYQNAFADMLLAAGSARAHHILMSVDERNADALRSEIALRALPSREFPLVSAEIEALASPDPRETADLILECFLLGARAAAKSSGAPS